MVIPNIHNAIIEDNKIIFYLLNINHPDGGSKAKWFINQGFQVENINKLKDIIIRQASENKVSKTVKTNFGTKYIVEGNIKTLKGSIKKVKTIWIIPLFEDIPKLVTIYPI